MTVINMVTVILNHILILGPPEIKLISLSEKSSATVWHTQYRQTVAAYDFKVDLL